MVSGSLKNQILIAFCWGMGGLNKNNGSARNLDVCVIFLSYVEAGSKMFSKYLLMYR